LQSYQSSNPQSLVFTNTVTVGQVKGFFKDEYLKSCLQSAYSDDTLVQNVRLLNCGAEPIENFSGLQHLTNLYQTGLNFAENTIWDTEFQSPSIKFLQVFGTPPDDEFFSRVDSIEYLAFFVSDLRDRQLNIDSPNLRQVSFIYSTLVTDVYELLKSNKSFKWLSYQSISNSDGEGECISDETKDICQNGHA
jgi:hypothetical protein